MSVSVIMAKIAAVKGYIGASVVVVGAAIVLLGLSKMPAKQDAFAATLEAHQAQADQTNRKLDVLICLQAKLDTPIRCVAREHENR